jgi:hypothetical protein
VLSCLFRLLTLLLVACPIVMAMVAFDTQSPSKGMASKDMAIDGFSETPTSDDTPCLTRLGNEIDDPREAVSGPVLRFEPLRRPLAAFAPRQADRIDTLGDPPPDRPPRSIA